MRLCLERAPIKCLPDRSRLTLEVALSDAFKGRTVAGANGNIIPVSYYFGKAGTNYGGIRTSPVGNVTMSFVELL